jgi:phytoene dehydrogenase-like protein
MTTATVVGSGPNGLAAAVTLAQHGITVTVLEAQSRVGGGLRSSNDLTIPGLLHDDCAAFHPMAAGSSFLRSLPLAEHGLTWRYPEIDAAHPLDGGDAGFLHRSIEATAAGLGPDGPGWRSLFGPLSERYDRLAADVLRPLLSGIPRHPLLVARLGLSTLLPAAINARRWKSPTTRALYGGVAAHAMRPLTGLLSGAIGTMIVAAGHRYGWPVAAGGSQSIAAALVAVLESYGGRIETGRRVTSLAELGAPDIVMLDLEPVAAADVIGDVLPARVARAYRRFRRAPGAFKIDLAVQGGIPWTNPEVARAGTVHLAGSLEELRILERDVQRGIMPENPFVLVGQQYVADPSRSVGDVHPVYAYAHVPNGYPGDATEAILRQFERFAPGTRERVLAVHSRGTVALHEHDANFVGGDIITGQNDLLYTLSKPVLSRDPYRTGVDGVYLCSAATPPGAGAHGLSGHNAALSALRTLGRA